ncbi:hypothetical protein ACOSQ2_024103 [Xanthoceras sorbifolium]
MSLYQGPRFKKIRHMGTLLGLTSKRPGARSDLRNQSQKQKLHFHYGLTERQLLKCVRIVGKAKGSTGLILLQLLEMHLDYILFRLGMTLTIPQARQLVNHFWVISDFNYFWVSEFSETYGRRPRLLPDLIGGGYLDLISPPRLDEGGVASSSHI